MRLRLWLLVCLLAALLVPALPAEQAAANVRNTALVFLTAMDASSYKPATYTEGTAGLDGMAHFRVRANPYVHGGSFPDPLTIRYRITQEGSYVSGNDSQGTAWLANVRTTTVTPTSNIADIYVPITDDDFDEADGSITFEILWGSNYIIEQSRNPTTVFVKDDDTPRVSWGGNTLAVVEGSTEGKAVLRVKPRPHEDITVRLWTEEPRPGRWSATEGSDYAGQTSLDVPIDVDSSSCNVTHNECNVTVAVNGGTTSGVQIMDDADEEDYEHFYLKIAGGLSGYRASGRDGLRVTIIDDESPPPAPGANGDGTYTVPMDWPLVPEDLRETGGEFRLLFLTNDWHDATTSNIAEYDAHVRASIAGSHTGGSHLAITPYSDAFKVVGSTPTVNARDHIDAGRDTAIYWLNGDRVAKDNAGFWSDSWENWSEQDRRTAASVSVEDRGTRTNWHWTGTNADGTKHSLSSMGSSGHVVRGQFFEEGRNRVPWVGNSATRVDSNSLLGISPVFRVEKRPRLEIVQADVEEPLELGLLGRQGRQPMLVVGEPAACATAPNDVSELGGVTHPSDLASYRVRLYADPGGNAPLWIYNPKYVVYRQGGLATGPVDSDHWNEIWKREIAFSNFYNNGITVRPPGEDTTYAVSGGPPRNTFFSLNFDSSNWDQWQTVNVNVHCADHEDHNAYIIQHELTLPGDRFNGRNRIGRGITWDLTTWHDVRVKVLDTKSPQPADLTVDTAYAGGLQANAGDSVGIRCDRYAVGGECEFYFNIHWYWNTPLNGVVLVSSNKPRNDLYDATENFSEFRIKVEADNSLPETPPTYVYSRDPSRVIGHDGTVNQEPYKAGIVNTGLKTTYRDRSNPGDPVYRITVTPVTLRNDEVPGEAVTFCVQLQSPSAWPSNKFSVGVDCSQFTPPSTAPPVIRRSQFSTLRVANSGSTITLSSNALKAPEGGEVTFTVTAGAAVPVDTPVIVAVTEEMGAGADLIASEQFLTLVIKAGQTSASHTHTVYSDDDARSDGTLVAQIAAGDGYTLGEPSGLTLRLIDDDGGSKPEVSVTAGGGITEGGDATFTVTADPASAADLDVTVTVSATGDFGATAGPQTVTIPTSGSATFTVATSDDQTDEADGSVTATVDAGSDYTVSATQGSATVAVSDDDGPDYTDYQTVVDLLIEVRDNPPNTRMRGNAAHIYKWNRVLAAIGHDSGESAMPASEIHDNAAKWPDSPFKAASDYLKSQENQGQTPPPPPPTPEVSVTAGGDITEGDNVSFTLTATPAPSADLAVSVTVGVVGDFGVSAGSRTVTIPASGSATLTVATTDDSADESDGSVTVTINTGSGYTVGSLNSGTVAVADDDPPPTPVVSIAGGSGVTEGGSASFTVSASPAPASAINVTVTVTASGDFGANTGRRTVRIPPGQTSATFTVATTDDSTDESDGSVTATVNTGSGYTGSGVATVAVADNDDPPVERDQPDESVLAACATRPTLLISSPEASRSDTSVDFEVSLSCIPSGRPVILLTPVRDGDIGENILVSLSAEQTSTTVTVTIGSENQLGPRHRLEHGSSQPRSPSRRQLHRLTGPAVRSGHHHHRRTGADRSRNDRQSPHGFVAVLNERSAPQRSPVPAPSPTQPQPSC